MRFYNLMRIKAWFEKGYGLSHYLFKVIAVVGLTSQQLENTLWAMVGYTIFCFVLGFCFFHFNLVNAELEVMNRYDPFVKQMREAIKKRNI